MMVEPNRISYIESIWDLAMLSGVVPGTSFSSRSDTARGMSSIRSATDDGSSARRSKEPGVGVSRLSSAFAIGGSPVSTSSAAVSIRMGNRMGNS